MNSKAVLPPTAVDSPPGLGEAAALFPPDAPEYPDDGDVAPSIVVVPKLLIWVMSDEGNSGIVEEGDAVERSQVIVCAEAVTVNTASARVSRVGDV